MCGEWHGLQLCIDKHKNWPRLIEFGVFPLGHRHPVSAIECILRISVKKSNSVQYSAASYCSYRTSIVFIM